MPPVTCNVPVNPAVVQNPGFPLFRMPSFTSTVSPGSSTPLGPAEITIAPPLLRAALGTQLDVSVVLTVVEPLCPPAATRLSPTAAPATSERPTFSGGPGDQAFEPGS